MENEQIYIDQIDRLMNFQNVYFGIFLAILALFVSFAAYLQWKISDKDRKSIESDYTSKIKTLDTKSNNEIEELDNKYTKSNKEIEKLDKKSNKEMEKLNSEIEKLKQQIIDLNSGDGEKKVFYTITDLIENNIVVPGDKLHAKNNENSTAELLENGHVKYQVDEENIISSINSWLKSVYGWKTVSTYDYAVHSQTSQTLDELRQNLYSQEEPEDPFDQEPENNFHNIESLIEHNIVKPGDKLFAKTKENYTAELLENGRVKYQKNEDNVISSINAWLKDVYGWSSVSTYEYTVHDETKKTLDELRYNI